jgi:hypothetical protein
MTQDEIHDLAQIIVNHQGSFSEMVEYTENNIRRAISAAVAAERERTKEECAKAMCEQCAAGIPAHEGQTETWGKGRYIHWLKSEERYIGCGATKIFSSEVR